jgi:transposase, IS30 family
MGANYKHLTEQDRTFLMIMLEKRYSKSKIAQILKINPSTVYREIKRNSVTFRPKGDKAYWALSAQEACLKRRKRGYKLEKDGNLRDYVHEKLKAGWSPYQIEGRLKLENHGKCQISHETIYAYIYSDYGRRNMFYKKLRRQHFLRIKRNSRKKRIPAEMLILNRPEVINNRSEFGHWECDLMMFKQGIKENLITLRERNTRYMIAIKNQNKEATGTALALINTITKIKTHVKSITFDQGSEFQKYQWIKDCVEAEIYFCEPASPYQKGGIENGNGVLRTQLPRSYNVETLHQKNVNEITDEINNRPLKCLNYETPSELFFKRVKSG